MYKEPKEQHGGKFYLSALSSTGAEIKLEVHAEMKVEQVKDMAVKKLDVGGIDSSLFHLVRVSNGTKKLSNLHTIKSEGLSSNDCVLLYPVRQEISTKPSHTVDPPSLTQIRKATAHLPSNEASKEPKGNVTSSASTSAPLEQIFRKILLTLLDLSYQLMFFDEEAEEIFKKKFEVEVDEDLINQLTSMGFRKKRAREALILNDMNVQMSMEWMLKHGESMSEDEEEEDEKEEERSKRSVEDIHKRLNRWKKRTNSAKTNSVHVTSLMDMGFSKEECMQALTYNGNNLQTACNWLLGERVVPEEDPNDTLDPESDLYKAIVNNPTIHVGLHNKRVLEALEDMLENPQRRHNWANDPTVGSVILHILKLFHKYSTAVS